MFFQRRALCSFSKSYSGARFVHSTSNLWCSLPNQPSFLKANEPSVSFDLQANPSEPFYLTDHPMFSEFSDDIQLQAFAWSIELNAWNHGMEPIILDTKTHILLVRLDFIGHCAGFGTELRVVQAMRSSVTYSKARTADKVKKKAILGQVIPSDRIRIVFWHGVSSPVTSF